MDLKQKLINKCYSEFQPNWLFLPQTFAIRKLTKFQWLRRQYYFFSLLRNLTIYKKSSVRKRYGTTIDYILPALLSAIGLFCGNAVIKVFNSYTSPIVYSCLAAQPSTGKSKALNLVNSAISAVERHYKIPFQKSRQVNPPTTEALIRLLRELQNVIGNSQGCDY